MALNIGIGVKTGRGAGIARLVKESTGMKLNLVAMAALVNDKKALQAITEHDFSVAVREYAESRGFLVHYQGRTGGFGRDGKTWRSNAPKGFPDLFMVRAERAVAAELKAERGSTSVEQRRWLSALQETPVETHLFKPRDARQVMEVLT